MTSRIYLLDEHSSLLPMQEQPYDSEALLQELLAKHPDLLAGEQIDSNEPRRWLLVTREMPVPDVEEGSGRWALDHLFLDQDAIPTLVEVKRSGDTRIRREVLGQMLDYAANAVAYWPVENIRAKYEARCEADGSDPEVKLGDLIGEERDTADFWQQVKTNLQAGRIRMVFIADEIPAELRRIVEFLNGQMDPAEVLAIEIKQFVGEGMKTLVPRVVGQTESARQKRSAGHRQTRQWDEESFFADLAQRRGDDEVAVARRLLKWANDNRLRLWWGQGQRDGSFIPVHDNKNGKQFLFSVWTSGPVEIQFQHMTNLPFDSEAKRQELAHRLSQIDGISIPQSALTKRPSIPLAQLVKGDFLTRFIDCFDWALREIKAVE